MGDSTFATSWSELFGQEDNNYSLISHHHGVSREHAEVLFIAALDVAYENNLISFRQHKLLSNEHGRRGQRARQNFADHYEPSDEVRLNLSVFSGISRRATKISEETGLDIDKILESIGSILDWIIENEDKIKKVIDIIIRLVGAV